jgi:YHS domain-containing protein
LVVSLGVVVAVGVLASAALAGDKPKSPPITCPVSGGPASKDVSVDYRGGKVCFCCPGCVPKFQEDPAQFAVKANLQLAASGQAVQKGCPLTGGKVNPATAIKVGGVSVGFCCGRCKGKVAEADAKAQLEMVFSDKAFDKAFTVKKD